MALNSLLCADVPLKAITHSLCMCTKKIAKT